MSWSKSVLFLESEPIYSLMIWLQLVMLAGIVLVAFRAKKRVISKAKDDDDQIDMGVNEDENRKDHNDDGKIDKGVNDDENRKDDDVKTTVPVSVNYHFTRQCNYSCGFCFHTAKTSFVLPIEEAKRGLSALAKAGMKKINFSGGEPFLVQKGRFLGQLVRFCKEDLDMESVCLVTNGSKVTEAWMEEYGYYLDIMAVSCDSFDEKINKKIGRSSKVGSHMSGVGQVREWCSRYGVMFKLNTVVNKFNWKEDMTAHIRRLNPVRWKVFQCLSIEAENLGSGALRQVTPYLVSESEWTEFLSRHSSVACLVPENNEIMQNSYIILDEFMRFLDNTSGSKVPSPSILDVGVEAALDGAGFDERMFLKRGGKYKWSKGNVSLDW